MRGLRDKVVVVTGAGRGMGQAIAERLAAEGARVAVTDVDRESALAAAGKLDGAAGFRLDITDATEVSAGIDEIVAALGPIDALVNNAGWDRLAPFLETDEDLWDRIIDINLRGPIRMTKAVLPQMVERQGGRIVNISSDAGRVGSTGEAVYSACKAGIIGFGKTVAREMARHGITVNAICPGPTATPLLESMVGEGNDKLIDSLKRGIPMRRLGLPEDIAGAVAFVVSEDAGFITGQTLSVSGGLTMA
ncbi:MAG TPA: 3-oxoacyl-ACP reductase family protein [Acidimicrobiia bacterium]|jgi:2-hydroxycyclohexanecarboxyl-CoA dehydrogenase|nr:3-oxoacyl-ACP reductase family protein [Acidimicrobiia bacterium]